MSRSVSAPSSVTNTSPCWNGLIVPGSTFRYGSNFWTCTLRPRALSSRPSDAAVMPLPSDDTTPPVTKMNFVSGALTSGPSDLADVRIPRNPHGLQPYQSAPTPFIHRPPMLRAGQDGPVSGLRGSLDEVVETVGGGPGKPLRVR